MLLSRMKVPAISVAEMVSAASELQVLSLLVAVKSLMDTACKSWGHHLFTL